MIGLTVKLHGGCVSMMRAYLLRTPIALRGLLHMCFSIRCVRKPEETLLGSLFHYLFNFLVHYAMHDIELKL